MKSRSPIKPRYDQNLVADQPGRAIFFSGVLLAVVFGLAIRGLIAPQKVQGMVRSAASRIHQNMKVNFDTAYVSLSEKGFPRLAVVINKVEMDSDEVCWGKPLLKAKQIILPVSFISLLLERQPFRKVQARGAEIDFREARTSCEVKTQVKAETPPDENQVVTLVNPRKNTQLAVESTIDELEIDYLKLSYPTAAKNPIEVVDFILQAKSHSPKLIVLEAKTHLVKDPLLQNYASHGQVHLEYKEFPNHELLIQFFGNWREGSYSLNANYNFADMNLTSDVDLKHIPAAQVISVLRDYGWLREDFDGRKIWVTMKGHSQGSLNEWQKLPLTISDFRLEGDVGEVQVPYFHANQLKPFIFKPMVAQVRNLNIDRFLEFLKRPRELQFIGKLGEFNGQLDLYHEDELKLSGQHTGLEFIFSSRGQRQVQTVSSLKGDFTLKNNRWKLNVKDVVLEQGKFAGDLKLGADREFKDIEVKVVANELRLSPLVQRLVSNGGEIPLAKGEVQAHIKNGKIEMIKGNVSSPRFVADAMSFEKFSSQFDAKNGLVNLQLQSQGLSVSPRAETYAFFKRIMKQETAATALNFKQISGKLQVTPENEMNWKNLSLTVDGKPGRLTSEGGWNKLGFLNGQVVYRGSSNVLWYLSGHRDQPKITESNGIQSSGH